MNVLFILILIFLMLAFRGKCQMIRYDTAKIDTGSLIIKMDGADSFSSAALTSRLPDSVGTGRKEDRTFLRSTDNHKKYNNDIIVFDPSPFNDNMPNANVTTPGIHYHLKILKYRPSFPVRQGEGSSP